MRIHDTVEWILGSGQDYRDSDKRLLLAVWEREGLYLSTKQQQIFMRCSSAESITRARRALKHKYPASPEVEESRYHKFVDYKRQINWWEH